MKLPEVIHVLIAVIVLAFSTSFLNLSFSNFIYSFMIFAVIFIVYIAVKKTTALFFQSSVETKIWQFQRYGYYERSYLKNPIPIGVILPFLLSILSLGHVTWFAVTQSEITATKARVAKKHGIYRFSEITDSDIGWICASGIIACLVFAVIAYLLNIPELSKFAVLFASFNMLPLGKLDGTKIFFANTIILWAVLAVFCLIGLGYVFFLI